MLRRDVEALLDRAADTHARERVERAAAQDPALADEIERTRRVIARLAEPLECPDFSGKVMRALDRETPFLDRRGRRRVRIGRIAVASTAFLLVAGVVASYRIWPGWSMSSEPAPIAAVVDSARADASTGVSNLVSAINSINDKVFSSTETFVASKPMPSVSIAAGQRLVSGPLTMGDTSKYAAPVVLDPSSAGSQPSGSFTANTFRVDSAGEARIRMASGMVWRVAGDVMARPRPLASGVPVPFHPERGMAFTSLWESEWEPEELMMPVPPPPPEARPSR
jgi:hypothetical protein